MSRTLGLKGVECYSVGTQLVFHPGDPDAELGAHA